MLGKSRGRSLDQLVPVAAGIGAEVVGSRPELGARWGAAGFCVLFHRHDQPTEILKSKFESEIGNGGEPQSSNPYSFKRRRPRFVPLVAPDCYLMGRRGAMA